MIQLFDTHRLSYRNAKLRAWALVDQTRRINFQNYADNGIWTSVGADIMTDESGYLFSGDGSQKIECLGVEEAAVVEVSLDGGHSYLIQFTIHPDHDPEALHASQLYGLTYTTATGGQDVYNPATGPKTLPRFLLKTEYSQGDWRETTIITEASDIDGDSIAISKFTHFILINAGRANGSGLLTFDLPENQSLRAGQVITVYANYTISISFNTKNTPTEQFKLLKNHCYIVCNNADLTKVYCLDVTGTNSEYLYMHPVHSEDSKWYTLDMSNYSPYISSIAIEVWATSATVNNETLIRLTNVPPQSIDIIIGCRNNAASQIRIYFESEANPLQSFAFTASPSSYAYKGCRLIQAGSNHVLID